MKPVFMDLRRMRRAGLAAALIVAACARTEPPEEAPPGSPPPPLVGAVRIAAFNAHMNRAAPGALIEEAASGTSAQIAAVAEIIQRVRPDILLINEFDRDAVGRAPAYFKAYYLAKGWNGAEPIDYPYGYFARVNTGIASGQDLDRDGRAVSQPGAPGYAEDAIGYGAFSGQYGMAVFSRYPIDEAGARTFQTFLWKDMPGALLPDDEATPEPGDFYPTEALAVLRLSSKSHWDLPVRIGSATLRILASHPTPPAFDGPKRRNRLRNHDEIRLWADYLAPERAGYIYDDRGRRGGLPEGERFVVLGDLNADPEDGASHDRAARLLLDHPRIDGAVVPTSRGGLAAANADGGANAGHIGNAAADTANFSDDGDLAPGNLRVDYALPSRRGLRVVGSGVFWPAPGENFRALVGEGSEIVSSDHRMVYIDVEIVESD